MRRLCLTQGSKVLTYSNQKNYANDYVRKHDPLILFDSATNNATRLQPIKNFTSFNNDLNNQKLPQWSFVTPNMTDD
jgi:acid phosphatase